MTVAKSCVVYQGHHEVFGQLYEEAQHLGAEGEDGGKHKVEHCEDEDEEGEHHNSNGDDIGVHSEATDEVGEQKYLKY